MNVEHMLNDSQNGHMLDDSQNGHMLNDSQDNRCTHAEQFRKIDVENMLNDSQDLCSTASLSLNPVLTTTQDKKKR